MGGAGNDGVAEDPLQSAPWRAAFEHEATQVLDAALGLQATGGSQPRALAEAVESCLRLAGEGGLKGVRHLGSLLVPALRGADQRYGSREADQLAAWAHRLVGLAAGAIEADEAPELLSGLTGLPGFPVLPESFETMIVARLSEDARALSGTVQAAAEARAMEAPECARDELDLLAAEMERFAEEVCPRLLAIEAQPGGAPAASAPHEDASAATSLAELLDEYAQGLQQLQRAAGYLSFGPLAQWCAQARRQVDVLAHQPEAFSEPLRAILLSLPAVLVDYFGQPGGRTADELLALLVDPEWPQPLDVDQGRMLATALGRLKVIGSRSVGRRSEDIDPRELALELPPDADPRVVDHLLRELPQLAQQFSSLVETLPEAGSEAVEQAQRIAHTLKGTANTVGVAGIASLTHQLEDLLQLVGRDQDRAVLFGDGRIASAGAADAAPLQAVLMSAADCLADMCDTVAGFGPPPQDALQVFRSVVRWTNRLLDAGAEPGQPASEQAPVLEAPATLREPEVPEVPKLAERREAIGLPEVSGLPEAADLPEVAALAGAPEVAEPRLAAPEPEAYARIPMSLIERLLELTGEAAIRVAQAQERAERLVAAQRSLRVEGEQLESLVWELDRIIDVRGTALTARDARTQHEGFDPLELDEYNELHMVSRRISEAGADTKLLDSQIAEELSELREALAGLERLNAALHETAFQARLVPVDSVAPRLRRALRQAARLAGKEVELALGGERTQVDDELLQRLLDPLMHLLRNAVDHGIEAPGVREALGKPPQGRVELSFERRGASLVVRCRDDGAGLDLEGIAARARRLGLLGAAEAADAARLERLVFAPGFSTRDAASQLSGRGIGLDVVRQRVAALGGSIALEHAPGHGCLFTLTLPERLTTVPVMVARAAGHVLAIAANGIRTIAGAGLPEAAADGATQEGEPQGGLHRAVHFGGRAIPTVRLERLLGLPERLFCRDGAGTVIAIVDLPDGSPLAVLTPELTPTRHVLLRPFAPYLGSVGGIEGVAVLGDGSVAAVLDLAALAATRDSVRPLHFVDEPVRMNAPVCLVIDDSVSVRRSTELFARDLGFEVDTAGDGMEGLACLERRAPDLVIVDLEMPRMNGVEFTAALRERDRGRAIPVIMITSRYSEKHRRLAADAGVDVFLTKPYTDDQLATHIHRCMQRRLG